MFIYFSEKCHLKRVELLNIRSTMMRSEGTQSFWFIAIDKMLGLTGVTNALRSIYEKASLVTTFYTTLMAFDTGFISIAV